MKSGNTSEETPSTGPKSEPTPQNECSDMEEQQQDVKEPAELERSDTAQVDIGKQESGDVASDGAASAGQDTSGEDQTNTVEEGSARANVGPSETSDSSGASDSVLDEHKHAEIEIQARLLRAAEAMIFAADEPVPPHRITEVFADITGRMQPDLATVEAHVEALNQEYESTGRALVIHEWAGGYRMTTRPELSPFVKALVVGEQETSLSRSLLETLAVLAYRQPVTRPEVDFVRGVNSDYAIRKLLDLGLADVKGRSESLGRPLLYGTTDRFLEQFGLNTLEDLPTLREIEDLLDDPNFDEERSQLLQLDTEKEITDRETAKEVLSEAREKVQSGELDADDIMNMPGDESAQETGGGTESEETSGDNVDIGAGATTDEE